MASPYDDMGPRIDLGDAPQTEPGPPEAPYPSPGAPATPPPRRGGGLAVVSLIVALAALAVAAWAAFSRPEPVPGPPMSPEVVPGGAAERVAKLEKDVGQLMLRLVTLEKELQSLANKAGTVTQLTELNAKVAALQDRLDNLIVESRLSSLAARKRSTPAAAPSSPQSAAEPTSKKAATPAAKPTTKAKSQRTAAQPPKPAPKKKLKRKKLTYVVRRGDTLFTIAQRYKVRMKDLMRWNNLKRGDVLKVGDKLVIYK